MNTPLSTGKNPPQEVSVFIEIPQNGNIKYEVDEKTGIVTVDRFLHTAFTYPFNYGFIPNTKAEDGDPVDVLVITDRPIQPGIVVPACPIGMLEMEDEEGIDTKIIAVPTKKVDPYFGEWSDISDVPEAVKAKIKHFFEHYKELEKGKWVKVREWQNKEASYASIQKGLK
jgi:inorganic pyrophosphatase